MQESVTSAYVAMPTKRMTDCEALLPNDPVKKVHHLTLGQCAFLHWYRHDEQVGVRKRRIQIWNTSYCFPFLIYVPGSFRMRQSRTLYTKKIDLKKVMPLCWSFCGFVVLTNLSLQHNSVGFYQVRNVEFIVSFLSWLRSSCK